MIFDAHTIFPSASDELNALQRILQHQRQQALRQDPGGPARRWSVQARERKGKIGVASVVAAAIWPEAWARDEMAAAAFFPDESRAAKTKAFKRWKAPLRSLLPTMAQLPPPAAAAAPALAEGSQDAEERSWRAHSRLHAASSGCRRPEQTARTAGTGMTAGADGARRGGAAGHGRRRPCWQCGELTLSEGAAGNVRCESCAPRTRSVETMAGRILHLFSGTYGYISHFARPNGILAEEVDVDWRRVSLYHLQEDGAVATASSEIGRRVDADLADREVQLFYLGRIRAGEFAAVIMGPPCSTFSIALGTINEGKDHALRSRPCPDGRPDLSTPGTSWRTQTRWWRSRQRPPRRSCGTARS